MAVFRQDEVGRCDFIDVLEEAALKKASVAVQLRSGETFIDRVLDVRTASGADFAVFEERGEVRAADIASMTRG